MVFSEVRLVSCLLFVVGVAAGVIEDVKILESFLGNEMDANERGVFDFWTFEGVNLTKICRSDLKEVLKGINNREIWAMQIYDSMPKRPLGILYGSHYQLGNFDECVKAKQPMGSEIRGKYCLADVQPMKPQKDNQKGIAQQTKTVTEREKFNATIFWSVCIPSSCDVSDTKKLLENFFKNTKIENLSIRLTESMCYTDEEKPYNTLEILFGTSMLIFLLFILFSTVYHYLKLQQSDRSANDGGGLIKEAKRPQGAWHEVLLCFSLISSVRGVFTKGRFDSELDCVSGMKVLSMAFIICAHGLLFMISGPVMNTDFYDEATLGVENSIFLNAPILVETFLLCSGFFVCRSLLAELKRQKGTINFWKLYVGRYIRLTPAYAVVIGYYCTFFARSGNGPLWNKIELERDRCLTSWWANLLYVNNYVNTDYLCMFQSWNLSVDTQLFLLSPLLVYPLYKWRRFGEVLLVGVASLTIAVPFACIYRNHFDPALMAYAPEMFDLNSNRYFVDAYIKTHMHSSSYILGVLFGYVIHRLQFAGKKLSARMSVIGWTVSALCGFLSMFTLSVFFAPSHEYNVAEAALYGSLHRVGWCVSIGWILFCCMTGNAALVNKFLSLRVFQAFSKITYCTYLVNGIVVLYYQGSFRNPVHMSVASLTALLFSQLAVNCALAFVLCVLFELPFNGLKSVIFKRIK